MQVEGPNGRVLVVDDEPAVCSVLNEALDREGFDCRSCTSGEEALNLLRQQPFDVVITDLYMPGLSGISVIEQGRKLRPESSFLMATGEADARVSADAMKRGAVDYLVKPFQMHALVASVREAQERKLAALRLRERGEYYRRLAVKRSAQLRRALEKIDQHQDETLGALRTMLDVRDNEIAGHGQRVCLYTIEIAKASGVDRAQMKHLARAALLHDIGKLGVPDAILFKPASLTPEETAIMRTHVEIGYAIVRRLNPLVRASEIVLAHHERYDGLGYPHGLKGSKIPLGARIFAVADTLDAMTSDRPYRKAGSLEAAIAEIEAQSGRQFDPEIVRAFLTIDPNVWREIRSGVQDGEDESCADCSNMTAASHPISGKNFRRAVDAMV